MSNSVSNVSPYNVFVSFKCMECDEHARVNVLNIIECGAPYCTECDCDMEMSDDHVEVEH